MRELADRRRIEQVMDALGRAAETDVRIYLLGGTTAVLIGWRSTTVDVDCVIRPEHDALLRAIPAIKESLQVNLELASPLDFIPVPEGWQDRSKFITRRHRAHFFHFDLYAQALAKIERGHRQDVDDVRAMIERGLIEPRRGLDYYGRMEPDLYRFPAIDPPSFRRAVEHAFAS